MAATLVNVGLRVCSRTLEVGNCSLANSVPNDTLVFQRFFHLGVRYCKPRKRYEWRRDRPPANTKLTVDGEEVLETRRTFGGGSKVKAVFKSKGNYTLKSQGIELQVPILDVIHSDSHRDHVKKKILTKGAIVQIDGTEFKNRLDGMILSKSDETSTETEKAVSITDSNEGTLENLPTCGETDKTLIELMKSGTLYGRITTRPGQVGLCDGYILEGTELETIMKKLSINSDTVN